MEKIDEQIENLWNMEKADDCINTWSRDDHKVIDLWNNELEFVDGHYCLPIPWKGGQPEMPNNKYVATKRLENLVSRLHRTGLHDKYEQNLNNLVQKGYAEPLPDDELCADNGTVWYLPHHNVSSKLKPEKLRILSIVQLNLKFHKS